MMNARLLQQVQQVSALLLEQRATVAVAESCTGGLLGHWLTSIPGSSGYFLGGLICYSTESKRELLGVSPETLHRYGAVSGETAQEMAARVRLLFGASYALAITGIAGPAPGDAGEPVGLIYVGLASEELSLYEEYRFAGERLENKEQAVVAALALLVRCVRDGRQGL
ncbi:MAG: CinA family protein [Chloroflexi bacterium]|nr:CinA family protein [Chloroflexota bacterium]